jgi:glycosyltransferase involved in cell wall biosynthesis
VELDDLIRYFDHFATPTGIGRVQLEILPRLIAAYPDRVSFCRIGNSADDMQVIPPEKLWTLLDGGKTLAAAAGKTGMARAMASLQRELKRTAQRLHHRMVEAGRARRAFLDTVRQGDVILALGGSWSHAHFGASVRELKRRHAMRFCLLIHDILPVSHPEFVSSGHRPNFERWLDEMRRAWDIVLTPSQASKDELASHLAAIGQPVPPIQPIPFGFGFTQGPQDRPAAPVHEGPYALFVSTIEIRKNHILLYRLWERLIATHGRERVPALVLAGSKGWGADQFWRSMHATNGLGGKIRVVTNLSDGQMARAYDDCLFTVFPSLCEGWGLPVSESLYHGKLCIASNATSLPEVGGPASDYFDPRDDDSAYTAVERAIFEPGYVAAREKWIAGNFRLPVWEDTAHAIMQTLTPAAAASAAAR